MRHMPESIPDLPWYRQFWPWLLISLPATAVLGSIATILIALHEPDGLVVGDYYKQGLAINETLARDRNAHFLGLHADGRVDVSVQQLTLTLRSTQPVAAGRLRLSILHPTRANQDQVIWLAGDETEGRYQASLPALAAGNWHLILEPEQGMWRLAGRLAVPGKGTFELQPQINNNNS